MHFVYHVRSVKTAQMAVVHAMQEGFQQQGYGILELIGGFDGVVRKADGVVIVGIGGGRHPTVGARTIFDAYLGAGKRVIFADKGYTRANTFRVVVDGFQPKYLMDVERPGDRLAMSHIGLQPFGGKGNAVLFDGASLKYCAWCGLPSPEAPNQQEWGRQIIAKIRQHTDRPILYRPRPSHNTPIAVEGATLSTETLVEDFDRAAVVVSHGGNIGFDAIVAGKPHFMIEESIAWPVSETNWDKLDDPFVPTDGFRLQWLRNVRYSEFSLEELRDGTGWQIIRGQLELAQHRRDRGNPAGL